MTPAEINKAFHEEVAEAQERARQRFTVYYDSLHGRKTKNGQVSEPEPSPPAPATRTIKRRVVRSDKIR